MAAKQTPKFQFKRRTRTIREVVDEKLTFPLITKLINVSDSYEASCPILTANTLLWIRGVENQQRVVLKTADGKVFMTVPLNTTDKYSVVYHGGNYGIPQLLRDVMKVTALQELRIALAENTDMCFSRRPDLADPTSYGPLQILGVINELYLICQLISDRLELSATQTLLSTNTPLTLDVAEGLHMNTPQEFAKCIDSLRTQRSGEPTGTDILLLSSVPKSIDDAANISHACRLYRALAINNAPRDIRIRQPITKGQIASQSFQEDISTNTRQKSIDVKAPPKPLSKSQSFEQTEPIGESVYDLKKVFNGQMPASPSERNFTSVTSSSFNHGASSSSRAASSTKPLPPLPSPQCDEIYENCEEDIFQTKMATGHITDAHGIRPLTGLGTAASVKEISRKLESTAPIYSDARSLRQSASSTSMNVTRNNSSSSADSLPPNHQFSLSPPPVLPNNREKFTRQESTPTSYRMPMGYPEIQNYSPIAAPPPLPQSGSTKTLQKSNGYVKIRPPVNDHVMYEDVEDWRIEMHANETIVTTPPTIVALSTQRSDWHQLDDVPLDLTSFSVDDVTKVLRLLKIDKYSKKLAKQDVDGALLMSLEEPHLVKTFKMSPFDANKLVQFRRGWRPIVKKDG